MYSKIFTASTIGIDSQLISVETDISEGMPVFLMVGVLSPEVKEAKERVRTSLKNTGISLPVKRITVNISPASIKKNGTGFDLPIGVSLLQAMGMFTCNNEKFETTAFSGELGLNGQLRPVTGILPMTLCAKAAGLSSVVVPMENVLEASLVPGIKVVGINTISEVITYLNEGIEPVVTDIPKKSKRSQSSITDFSDINGMPFLRRACEIAVSGMHNMLMIGPPGSGKSFVSKALPSIMPPLSEGEQLELSKIYSVSGLFGERKSLMKERPFRSPHHTISDVGLTGGGPTPKPGEISLAHKGILFLDEMLEFKRSTIEILRQPMEEGKINIVRSAGECTFPADFMLVGAMNPCPCGYYPDLSKCKCTQNQRNKYISKLSRPLSDRIDISVQVPLVGFSDIVTKNKNESSRNIRKRVVLAHEIQRKRYEDQGFLFNAQIPAGMMEEYCKIGEREEDFIRGIFDKMELTARSYHKILKVARTIADMEKSENISLSHIEEAVALRSTWGEGMYVS